jgi:hypothetical protein
MIKKYSQLEEDYRGGHEAPDHTNGAPLYNPVGIYPEDIYSINAARYYGDGSPFDHLSAGIIQYYRNKPNAKIPVYRAVPKVLTNEEKINEFLKHKQYILKNGKLPPGVDNWRNSSEYYDFLYDEINRLKALPESKDEKITINPGDWVTICKQYAVDHGKSNLNGKYRILSKTVFARDLFTEGNSLHEWGYDPQPPVKK